jgi:hypothetical protein
MRKQKARLILLAGLSVYQRNEQPSTLQHSGRPFAVGDDENRVRTEERHFARATVVRVGGVALELVALELVALELVAFGRFRFGCQNSAGGFRHLEGSPDGQVV